MPQAFDIAESPDGRSRPRPAQALLVACEGAHSLYLRSRLSLRQVACADVAEAEAAIEFCAERPVDLVVVDLDHLGEPAGWALVRQLRVPHACRPAPKLAVLGCQGRWRRWRASMTGLGCLDKPLDPRSLDAWIVHCLGPARSGPVPASLFSAGPLGGGRPGRRVQFDGGT